MLSFVGWEAVAPLTTAFSDPARQLTRVVAIALAVTSALYLGLAIVTIGVLGPGAATIVPLAELLQRAIGPVGTAAAAVVLTLGSVNAYINGGAAMAGHLTRRQQGGGNGHASPAPPFLAVYLGSMLAAVRVLRGPARLAAVPASVAVVVMLACCGWSNTSNGAGSAPPRIASSPASSWMMWTTSSTVIMPTSRPAPSITAAEISAYFWKRSATSSWSMSIGIRVCSRCITSAMAMSTGVRSSQESLQVPTGWWPASTTNTSQKSVVSSSLRRR